MSICSATIHQQHQRTFLHILVTGVLLFVLYYLLNSKTEAESRRVSKISLPQRERHETAIFNIICFGDSLTEGLTILNGKLDFYPYSKTLQKLLSRNGNLLKQAKQNKTIYNVYNEGKSGERVIGEMTARLPRVLLKETDNSRGSVFDWVIILGGTNDLRVAELSGKYEMKRRIYEAIVSLHRVSHRRGARTVLVTIPGRQCELKAKCRQVKMARVYVNKYLRDYTKELGPEKVVLVDLARKMPFPKMINYWADEVHFTPAGYNKMAVIIYEALKEHL